MRVVCGREECEGSKAQCGGMVGLADQTARVAHCRAGRSRAPGDLEHALMGGGLCVALYPERPRTAWEETKDGIWGAWLRAPLPEPRCGQAALVDGRCHGRMALLIVPESLG